MRKLAGLEVYDCVWVDSLWYLNMHMSGRLVVVHVVDFELKALCSHFALCTKYPLFKSREAFSVIGHGLIVGVSDNFTSGR